MSSSGRTADGVFRALGALLRGFADVKTGRERFAAGVVLGFGEPDSFLRIAFGRSSSIVHMIVHDECNALVTQLRCPCEACMGSMRAAYRYRMLGRPRAIVFARPCLKIRAPQASLRMNEQDETKGGYRGDNARSCAD